MLSELYVLGLHLYDRLLVLIYYCATFIRFVHKLLILYEWILPVILLIV